MGCSLSVDSHLHPHQTQGRVGRHDGVYLRRNNRDRDGLNRWRALRHLDAPARVVLSGSEGCCASAAGPRFEPNNVKTEPRAMDPPGSPLVKLPALTIPCGAMAGVWQYVFAARKKKARAELAFIEEPPSSIPSL